MIWGYPYFWKHPYIYINIYLLICVYLLLQPFMIGCQMLAGLLCDCIVVPQICLYSLQTAELFPHSSKISLHLQGTRRAMNGEMSTWWRYVSSLQLQTRPQIWKFPKKTPSTWKSGHFPNIPNPCPLHDVFPCANPKSFKIGADSHSYGADSHPIHP